MSTFTAPRLLQYAFALLLASSLLAACAFPPPPTTTQPDPTSAAAASAVPETTATIVQPTASPTSPPDKVILWIPEQSDALQAENLRQVIAELAGAQSLGWEPRSSLNQAELTPEVRLVVVLAPGDLQALPAETILELAASTPETHFLAIGFDRLEPQPNLTKLVGSGEHQAFLAGTLAILVTPERRVGVLNRADSPTSQAAREAFLNGARYECGLCNPKYPPYAGYPVFAEATGPGDWQAAVDALAAQGVKTVYIEPELQKAGLLELIALAKMKMIGGTTDGLTEAVKPVWIATLRLDPIQAVRDLWSGLLTGQEGIEVSIPIQLEDVRSDALSEGRMRVLEEIQLALEEGWIFTGTVPVE